MSAQQVRRDFQYIKFQNQYYIKETQEGTTRTPDLNPSTVSRAEYDELKHHITFLYERVSALQKNLVKQNMNLINLKARFETYKEETEHLVNDILGVHSEKEAVTTD